MLQTIMPVVQEVLSTLGSFIIVIAGAFCIYGLKLVLGKFGIEVTRTQYDEIVSVITNIIKAFYQKYTKTIKANSPDNKLTEYQSEVIKEKVIDAIKLALTADQIKILLEKYNAEEITDVLNTLIESIYLDVKNNDTTQLATIATADLSELTLNDTPMISNVEPVSKYSLSAYMPTEEELTKINMCSGNCQGCPFRDTCEYVRN